MKVAGDLYESILWFFPEKSDIHGYTGQERVIKQGKRWCWPGYIIVITGPG